MLLASGLTSAFLISGLSAYRLLKGDRSEAVFKSLKTAIVIAAVLIPVQILAGHEQGINTKKYQPAKLAAMEGAWETRRGAPLVLFAIPNEKERKNHFAIEIPYLASLITTNSIDGEIKGLNDFKAHPPVKAIFFGFRLMVGIGFLMLIISWTGMYFILKKHKMSRLYLYGLVIMTFSGTIATIAGWYVTEIGRQPWLVQGILTTKEALGRVSGGMVLSTLIVYLTVYTFLTIAYISTLFYM